MNSILFGRTLRGIIEGDSILEIRSPISDDQVREFAVDKVKSRRCLTLTCPNRSGEKYALGRYLMEVVRNKL